jgi:pSer/pThr/pTyr-binding forkhead associated (FHA) protein
LRFISGKYQGGEFPLEPGREVVVGRSSDLDMVLVEEMVSRKHARIELKDGAITIEDLGSTNGTFVNGERIVKAPLKEGDRVLIGSNILKVVHSSGDVGPPVTRRSIEPPGLPRPAARRTETEAARMTGSIEEIPLPDLMQLFGTSRKTGVLVVETETDVGKIYLDKGVLKFVTVEPVDGPPTGKVAPLKAVYRMLSWEKGTFMLDPPSDQTFEEPLDASVQEVLMEGFRQRDEFEHIKHKLPPMDVLLQAELPLSAPLRALDPPQLDVYQAILNGVTVRELFDATPLTDLDAANALMFLMDKGYVTKPRG